MIQIALVFDQAYSISYKAKGLYQSKLLIMGYWIVRVNSNEFEVWTNEKYFMMVRKCEYYGAQPFWLGSIKIESTENSNSSLKSTHC